MQVIFFGSEVLPPQASSQTFSGISLSGMAESNEEYQHGKPTEGMCCLCTMEDITEEDQNYGEKKKRGRERG